MIRDESLSVGERVLQLEGALNNWSKITRQRLQMRLASMGLKDRVRLRQTLAQATLYKTTGVRPKRKNGEIDSISILFLKHGIFLEHGVGKNRPVNSPEAVRAKRPWLSLELPGAVEELAELLATEYADIAAGQLKITIPGIYSTKISI